MKDLEKLSKTELIAELREFRKIQPSILENATEKRATEIELKESEERFRQMFEKHNAVMLLIEPETGKIIDANLSAQKFYGYSDEAFKQMIIQDINSLPEEKVLEILVKGGYIDLTDYFPAEQTNYNDTYKEYGGDNINREEED